MRRGFIDLAHTSLGGSAIPRLKSRACAEEHFGQTRVTADFAEFGTSPLGPPTYCWRWFAALDESHDNKGELW